MSEEKSSVSNSRAKKAVVSGLFWRILERTGAQGVTFLVSIVLARLLDPTIYGTVALVTVFITILQVFIDSGLGNALIQKKDADDLDFSSVFFFNMAICLIMYAIMFFTSPLIADFYEDSTLVPVIRVLSLTLIISGVKNVQQAYVSRNMQFKRFFFATLGGTLGAAAVGISLAYFGFGVWALVAQHLFNAAVDTLILWITVKWRPKMMFSFTRLKGLLTFGWKLLASSVIDTVYQDLRQLLIGKVYTAADLAYYNQGKKIPSMVINNIDISINSVLFPTFSKVQDDRERVKSMMRTSIRVSTYLMAPILILAAACADPLIKLILTEKWLPCVFFLRIACITYLIYPIHTANLSAINAMGRSDLFLKLEIIKKVIGVSLIFATMWISVEAVAIGSFVGAVFSLVINAWPNRKLLNYSIIHQIKDIMPPVLLAVFMGACVYSVEFIGLPDWLTLLIQIPLGFAIYYFGSRIFRIYSYNYLINSIKSYLKNRSKNKKSAEKTAEENK